MYDYDQGWYSPRKSFDSPRKRFSSRDLTDSSRKVGMASLVVLVFYSVSGGGYGIEEVVQAGGPFYALIGFSLLLVWAVPEALITAELSTTIPEASGAVAWVTIAFGPYWGFQKGWLSFLSGVADNSLYPILFFDYIVSLLSGINVESQYTEGVYRWGFIASLSLLLTYLNYRGLDVVGRTAIILCIFSVLPLAVFCVVGAFKVDPSKWLTTPENGIKGIDWRLFLNTFFWNINYWESSACYAGDVKDPGKNYPIALSYAVLLVTLSTFLPVLIGTGVTDSPYTEWTDGYFTYIAVEMAGPWLGTWMMLGAMVSNIGMFEAEMSSDSWQVAGMADRGIIPKFLGYRSQHGTPTYGILLSAGGVLALSWLSFSEVVEMLNILYCFAQIIEFAAFVKLRIRYPDMYRPYKIPLSTAGCIAMLAVPTILVLVIVGISTPWAVVSAGALALFGFVVALFLEAAEKHRWFEFENQYIDTCPSLGYAYTSSRANSEDNGTLYAACTTSLTTDDRIQEGSVQQTLTSAGPVNELTPLRV